MDTRERSIAVTDEKRDNDNHNTNISIHKKYDNHNYDNIIGTDKNYGNNNYDKNISIDNSNNDIDYIMNNNNESVSKSEKFLSNMKINEDKNEKEEGLYELNRRGIGTVDDIRSSQRKFDTSHIEEADVKYLDHHEEYNENKSRTIFRFDDLDDQKPPLSIPNMAFRDSTSIKEALVFKSMDRDYKGYDHDSASDRNSVNAVDIKMNSAKLETIETLSKMPHEFNGNYNKAIALLQEAESLQRVSDGGGKKGHLHVENDLLANDDLGYRNIDNAFNGKGTSESLDAMGSNGDEFDMMKYGGRSRGSNNNCEISNNIVNSKLTNNDTNVDSNRNVPSSVDIKEYGKVFMNNVTGFLDENVDRSNRFDADNGQNNDNGRQLRKSVYSSHHGTNIDDNSNHDNDMSKKVLVEVHKELLVRSKLISDFSDCRMKIEEKRGLSIEELIRRRKCQGLEILSRLVLSDPSYPASLPSTSSHSSSVHPPSSINPSLSSSSAHRTSSSSSVHRTSSSIHPTHPISFSNNNQHSHIGDDFHHTNGKISQRNVDYMSPGLEVPSNSARTVVPKVVSGANNGISIYSTAAIDTLKNSSLIPRPTSIYTSSPIPVKDNKSERRDGRGDQNSYDPSLAPTSDTDRDNSTNNNSHLTSNKNKISESKSARDNYSKQVYDHALTDEQKDKIVRQIRFVTYLLLFTYEIATRFI